MKPVRTSSLDPICNLNWDWQYFLDSTISSLSSLSIQPYPTSPSYLDKTSSLNQGNQKEKINISTWACKTDKLRQVRVACLSGSSSFSVFNLVFSPSVLYDVPFFGADFVRLPSGYLLALDLQPVLKNDSEHTHLVWERMMPLYQKWQSQLPYGGAIPEAATQFFSPAFLWARLPNKEESKEIIINKLRPAFNDYLGLYMELLADAIPVNSERSSLLREGQIKYLSYRAKKDPARGMLSRFYGKDWTESYIHNMLFDLSSI